MLLLPFRKKGIAFAMATLGTATVVLATPASTTIRDFQPLKCNESLATRQTCKSWQQVFGSIDSFAQRVVIPCGSCVELSAGTHRGRTITFSGGLDIQGKLRIVGSSDGSNSEKMMITLYASAIIVQGELVVETRGKTTVDGNPTVRFIMTGETEELFTPVEENANACYGSPFCLAGKKSITVAGGKVSREFLTVVSAINGD